MSWGGFDRYRFLVIARSPDQTCPTGRSSRPSCLRFATARRRLSLGVGPLGEDDEVTVILELVFLIVFTTSDAGYALDEVCPVAVLQRAPVKSHTTCLWSFLHDACGGSSVMRRRPLSELGNYMWVTLGSLPIATRANFGIPSQTRIMTRRLMKKHVRTLRRS